MLKFQFILHSPVCLLQCIVVEIQTAFRNVNSVFLKPNINIVSHEGRLKILNFRLPIIVFSYFEPKLCSDYMKGID